jgi:ketosteroid isomerase-like protein
MKRLLTCSLLAFIFCFPLLVSGRAHDAKEELANLDRKLNGSIYGGSDVALLDDLLADDWYGTTALGETHSKGELIEQIRKAGSQPKKGSPPRLEVSPAEVKIHVYGDTAIVSGFLNVKINGEEISPSRYVNVYMKRDGKWRAISTHYC